MEEWIEVEGASREDAIERACNALNTTRSYLNFEILGGNGRKIRARKLEQDEKDERDLEKKSLSPEEREDEEENVDGEEREEREGRGNRGNRRGREDKREARREREEESDEQVEDTEVGLQAKEYLEKVVSFIEDGAQVELRETEKTIELEIKGEGSGLLIGKHGQTLDAVQHLVAKMLKVDPREGKRIVVDSERYRARRRESLEDLAKKLANRARRERRGISADPMNAMDRRTLHMALADESSVETKSVGEGSSRRVMVVPKRGGSSRRGNDNRGRFRGGSGRNSSRNSGRSSGRGSGRGPRRDEDRQEARRRSGPRPRMHDSFGTPPIPKMDIFPDDPDAPVVGDEKRVSDVDYDFSEREGLDSSEE